MKTLREFIQRLQDDAAFEKKAQAFDNGDDLMAFVKREGYDFTLEQLTNEFKHRAKLPAEAGGIAPAPTDARASTPPRPDDAAFSRKPEAIPLASKVWAYLRVEAATLPGSNRGEGFRNQWVKCPPRERQKSRRESCPGLAAAGTGVFLPRD